MIFYPDIVEKKIRWYVWRNKMKEINEEYERKYEIYTDAFGSDRGIYSKDEDLLVYNYRYYLSCIREWDYEIYNKGKMVGRVVENYWGVKKKDLMNVERDENISGDSGGEDKMVYMERENEGNK